MTRLPKVNVNIDETRAGDAAFGIDLSRAFLDRRGERGGELSIDNVDVALGVAGNAGRIMKICIGGAEVPPQDNEVAGAVELLNPIVAIVHDKNGALLVDSEPVDGCHEFAAMQQGGAAPRLTPFRHT